MASLLLLPKLLFSAKALHWPPKWCELFSYAIHGQRVTPAKICKIQFQFFHWRPGCTRNCCKFILFFAVLPSNDNINRITCHEAFMGWKNMRLWRPGENKQAGVRDGERCVNGQVALSLLAFFWDIRKNKERGVTDNWRQTATVHPCLDYNLMDYSRLDYLWLDYKDIWTIAIWTTYDVWTIAIWTTLDD